MGIGMNEEGKRISYSYGMSLHGKGAVRLVVFRWSLSLPANQSVSDLCPHAAFSLAQDGCFGARTVACSMHLPFDVGCVSFCKIFFPLNHLSGVPGACPGEVTSLCGRLSGMSELVQEWLVWGGYHLGGTLQCSVQRMEKT